MVRIAPLCPDRVHRADILWGVLGRGPFDYGSSVPLKKWPVTALTMRSFGCDITGSVSIQAIDSAV